MYTEFFRIICQMGIFMLCAQSIVHFRPRGSYEKYLKVLVGIMLLLQLLAPVGSLLFKRDEGEMKRNIWEFQKSLEEGLKEIEEYTAISGQRLESMTLQEVRKRLEEKKTAEMEEGISEEMEQKEPVIIEPVEQIQPIQIERTDGEGQGV